MKWLIVFLVLLVILLLGWYFFVPEAWLEPIVKPAPKEQAPEIVIPEGLFVPGPSVVDQKGNIIPTTTIGGNTWTTINAKITDCPDMRLGDGAEIGPDIAFYDGTSRYGYYNNDPSLGWGVVYTYKAVRSCQLCPAGFRVATKADWEALFTALGGAADRGKLLQRKYGSPFGAGMGGRVDSYGSSYAGNIEFWWALDEAPDAGERKNAWGPELKRSGELRLRAQDQRIANYVRCVKE